MGGKMKTAIFTLGFALGAAFSFYVSSKIFDYDKQEIMTLDLAQQSYITGCVVGSHLRDQTHEALDECIILGQNNRTVLKDIFDQITALAKIRDSHH
jgi:hypothetical protein